MTRNTRVLADITAAALIDLQRREEKALTPEQVAKLATMSAEQLRDDTAKAVGGLLGGVFDRIKADR